MFLSSFTIAHFRTISDPIRFELTHGLNVLAGPNNCGKGNALRALKLALDPAARFDRDIDLDLRAPTELPRIDCEFRPSHPGKDSSLEASLSLLEGSSGARPALGALTLRVEYKPGGRSETLLDPTGAPIEGNSLVLHEVIVELRRSVGFVFAPADALLVDLTRPLLQELLETDTARSEVDERVAKLREDYTAALRERYLDGVASELRPIVADVFPEARDVTIEPSVERPAAAIGAARIDVRDQNGYPIVDTGSGLRILATMAVLHRLAAASCRSYVAVLEEPEAYLHPDAQRRLRTQLERMAARPDLSVIITTESPFLVSTVPNSMVFAVTRDSDGVTRLDGSARGNDRPHAIVGELIGDERLTEIFDRTANLEGVDGVLIVEGYTDSAYIKLAAERLGRADFLESVVIIPADGAKDAALKAIVVRAESDTPAVVILDSDEHGKEARKTLRDRFGFRSSEQLLIYSEVVDMGALPTEAEDLFASGLLDRFVSDLGEEGIISGKRKIESAKRWRFDFTEAAKGRLVTWLTNHAEDRDLSAWGDLIAAVEAKLDAQRQRMQRGRAAIE
jgi:putative ATP-dependent endonuclease of OLD family